MKNKSIRLPSVTKNNKWWRLVSFNWINSLVKNRSVKLPFLTKNSKHFGETSAHDSAPLIEFTPLWKTRVSNYPLEQKIKISCYICIKEQNNCHFQIFCKRQNWKRRFVTSTWIYSLWKVTLCNHLFTTDSWAISKRKTHLVHN